MTQAERKQARAPERTPRTPSLGETLTAASMLPGVGDIAGPLADAHMFATDPESRTPGNLGLALAGLLPGIPSVGGVIRTIKPGDPNVIKDWRWRSPSQVRETYPMDELPSGALDYGDFMLEQQARARRGDLTPEDMVRAHTITNASIQRQARPVERFPAGYASVAEHGALRPEDAAGHWLTTPAGLQYLDSAVNHGVADPESVADFVSLFKPFGHQNLAELFMPRGASDMPQLAPQFNALISKHADGNLTRAEWMDATKDMYGFGAPKTGFFGSMLGYGGSPVLDARQLDIWVPAGKPRDSAQEVLGRKNTLGATQAVNKLAQRQQALAAPVPPEHARDYQYLVHHGLWDTAGETNTVHPGMTKPFRR